MTAFPHLSGIDDREWSFAPSNDLAPKPDEGVLLTYALYEAHSRRMRLSALFALS